MVAGSTRIQSSSRQRVAVRCGCKPGGRVLAFLSRRGFMAVSWVGGFEFLSAVRFSFIKLDNRQTSNLTLMPFAILSF
jgi:hypothetical protein